MPNACSAPVPAGCAPAPSTPRIDSSFARRYNTAVNQAAVSVAQTSNGDETLYPDRCATYSKAVLQDSPGKVNLAAFQDLRHAINAADFFLFEAVPLGGSRTLNGPMGAFAFTSYGADATQFAAAAPPKLASPLYATELIELYWCSLLRDVPFSDYHRNVTAQAAATELNTATGYAGPRTGGTVTPADLFRGAFLGENVGPYLSQFLLLPTRFGALQFDQRYATYLPDIDYMTDLPTWSAVQSGIPTGVMDQPDPVARYMHNGRALAAWTHVDELYQAYFTAYLVLSTLKVPSNPGSPYIVSHAPNVASIKQNPFGTFGGPDIAAVLGAVAKVALNAVWYQKWAVHLRHRPESGAGLVHLIESGVAFDGSPAATVFASAALAASRAKYGTALLSQPFPEGSPAHPAYPTGHGAVGGACITILKFFFDGNFTIPSPQVPTSHGTAMEPWNFDPQTGAPGALTGNGELHKLAHNITFGHGLHGGIHWRSDSDESIRFGEAVALSFLEDLACTYKETFSITLTKVDGSPRTISN